MPKASCRTETLAESPRILVIDIETSPNIAYVWGLWDQSVSLSQLIESTQVIAFAAKWVGDDEVFFYSDHHDGHRDMILAAHALLGVADIVVHYNGKSFDIKHLNREFWEAGYDPPAPYKQVDLMHVVKRNFRFGSNKLQHVTTEIGLAGKAEHEGMPLWVKCLEGDDEAWASMRAYNVQDVVLTEQLYLRARPWITDHPNMGLFVDEARPVCDKCGSTKMQKRGISYTTTRAYQRFQCQGCGGWSRTARAVNAVGTRGVAS
jgi:hypothetical protein